MKARFKGTPPTIQELKAKLEETKVLPDYTYKLKMNRFIVAGKSSTMGANILIGKDHFKVAGNFPSQGLQIAFVLFVFATVLIGALLYFIFLFPKHRQVEKEVVAALESLYYTDDVAAPAPEAAAAAPEAAAAAPAADAGAPAG